MVQLMRRVRHSRSQINFSLRRAAVKNYWMAEGVFDIGGMIIFCTPLSWQRGKPVESVRVTLRQPLEVRSLAVAALQERRSLKRR